MALLLPDKISMSGVPETASEAYAEDLQKALKALNRAEKHRPSRPDLKYDEALTILRRLVELLKILSDLITEQRITHTRLEASLKMLQQEEAWLRAGCLPQAVRRYHTCMHTLP